MPKFSSPGGYASFDKSAADEEGAEKVYFPGRAETIERIDRLKNCDVVIVGGGIHGASFARLAALNGLSAVLLEREDYAFGTSSRSSKMAHGGLRYLELLDFAQVFEGIRAREDLFETAPHLTKPHGFLIPVFEGQGTYRLKLALGLRLYDLFLKNRERRHRWIPASELPRGFGDFGWKLGGAFRYSDGILNDTRLVIENIVAARQEGAHCLNHADVISLSQAASGRVTVGWTDKLKGVSHEVTTGIVVNCAGPWAPGAGRIRPAEFLADRVCYTRGVHLLFDRQWALPPLFLPLAGKARYYWIWPHFAGTLVGTTDHPTEDVDRDPVPTRAEIDEVLERLARDVPGAELNANHLHYAFAGIRTLPLRKPRGHPSQLSRRHVWQYSGGMLTLLGGKLTTASNTAFEGMKMIYKLAEISRPLSSLRGRKLPGAALGESETIEFRRAAGPAADAALSRLGARVRTLMERGGDALEPLPGVPVLRGEAALALDVEQAETVEDVMRRRVDLEYLPGHGLAALGEVERIIADKRPGKDASGEARAYRERMAALETLLGRPA